MNTRLTKETANKIKSENKLAALVADEMGIVFTSLSSALSRNAAGLISYPVLKIISDYTGKDMNSLVEEYDDGTETVAKVETPAEQS